MFTFSHLYTPLIAKIANFPRDGMIEVRRPVKAQILTLFFYFITFIMYVVCHFKY